MQKGRNTMKSLLVSFSRWLYAVICWLVSHPQRVRLIVSVVVICLVLVALLVPSLTTLADPMGTVGH
jgi:hypothetical protein